MICPRCKTEDLPDAAFCDTCGSPLEITCDACGEPNRREAKFCKRCGQRVDRTHPMGRRAEKSANSEILVPAHLAEKIVASRNLLEGERKQVTVLFADIRNSTKMLEALDPEDAQRILDPALAIMMAAVHRYEGTVNQVLGDGIMALFGAPLAHEDHAVRACYAALAMQEAMRRHREKLGKSEEVGLQIGVGLNSGEVVVRSIDTDLNIDYSALGHTTHLAARMQEAANAGTILLTAATLRDVEGFVDVKSFGPLQVKGISRPIDAYKLVGATTARTRMHAAVSRGLTRLVGRKTEIDCFNETKEKTALGQGQVISLVGEPGVGKSRLVYEVTRSHVPGDWLVLEGTSVSYGKGTLYYPLIELLRRYFGIADGDAAETIQNKVVNRLFETDETFDDALPALLGLLGVLPESNQSSVLWPSWVQRRSSLSTAIAKFYSMDPQQRRRNTFDSVERVLIRESQKQPLLLIFEDLHRIDNETQAFLDRLVESLAMTRILLLVSHRPGYGHNWAQKTYHTLLRIEPLPGPGADELLELLLGGGGNFDDLKQLVIKRTEGNPFFLEECVRSLAETGVLIGQKGAYQLVQKTQTIAIPGTVQTALADRMDRLPTEEKRLLQTAAVIGVVVPLPLLRSVADVTEEELHRYLHHLQAGEYLYESSLFPELEYTFKHALVNEVAYSALLHERRAKLHARVMEAIEKMAVDDSRDYFETLAHHAFRGEQWQKSISYLRQAADKAMARSANKDAAVLLERALAAMAKLPDREAKPEDAVDLRLQLRNALFLLGEFEKLYHYLREAETIAEALGDQERLGRVLNFMISYCSLMADHERALAIGERALHHVRNDLALNVVTNYYMGVAGQHLGHYREAMSILKHTISMVDGGDLRYERFGTANIISVISRVWIVSCLAELGAFQEGLGYANQGIQIATEAEHPYSLAYSQCSLGFLFVLKGELASAIRMLEGCLEFCEKTEIRVLFPQIACCLGFAYAQCGRFDEAIPLLKESDEQTALIGRKAGQSLRVAWHGEASLIAGRLEEAKSLAERALNLAEVAKEQGNQAWALKVLGDIASRPGAPIAGTAEHYYTQALALATKLGMLPLQAHSHFGIGKLYAQKANLNQSRNHLWAAFRLYQKTDMSFWLHRTERVLEGLEDSQEVSASHRTV